MVNPEKLLTEAEVAELLGWQQTTLQRRRWAGLPPDFLKIGRSVRYSPAAIAAFVESGCRTSTSTPDPRPAAA